MPNLGVNVSSVTLESLEACVASRMFTEYCKSAFSKQ